MIVCGFTLVACIDGTATDTQSPDSPNATKSFGKTSEVSAPEIFSSTDRAVWDGRPTLGGIWIAHEKANTPSRATITNTATGKSITGALWSKTAGIPGPPFTVSSDLAASLGMEAGTPVELRVVALKNVVTEPAEPEPEPAENQEVAAAEPDPEPKMKDEAPKNTEAAAIDAETAAVEQKPKRKPFRVFGKRKEEETDEAVDATEEVTVSNTPTPTGSGRAAQVGLFSDKANADKVAAQLTKAGLGGKLIGGKSSSGASFWRVVTGPAKNKAAEAKLLADVKALGFTDAYLIKE